MNGSVQTRTDTSGPRTGKSETEIQNPADCDRSFVLFTDDFKNATSTGFKKSANRGLGRNWPDCEHNSNTFAGFRKIVIAIGGLPANTSRLRSKFWVPAQNQNGCDLSFGFRDKTKTAAFKVLGSGAKPKRPRSKF